jgi:peptidyl-prolyl cis-trans isomerase A (cyclophilin A)
MTRFATAISYAALASAALLLAAAPQTGPGTTPEKNPGQSPGTTAPKSPATPSKPSFGQTRPGTTPPPEPVPGQSGKDQTTTPSAEEPLVYVLMDTTKGDIILELNREKAPISVANFLAYTEKGHYDGTIFHRVISNFMIQGGGFTADMKQKPTDKPIKNEWRNGLKNDRGTISMARLGGNGDSATCQFFINVVNNAGLDRPQPDGAAYAVFGKVVAGMDVVDAIKVVATGSRGGHQNVPSEPVTIETAKRITDEEARKAIEAEKARTAAG